MCLCDSVCVCLFDVMMFIVKLGEGIEVMMIVSACRV